MRFQLCPPVKWIAPYQSLSHFARLKSISTQHSDNRKEYEYNGKQSTDSQPQRTSRRGKALLSAGIGIFASGLYYVLVNGPSRSAHTSDTEPLSPKHFTPLTLTSSILSTPYTKLLTLSLPTHLIPEQYNHHPTPIFSIYIKDSDIQIERSYTPLDGIDAQGRMRFWVKRYQGGEVGRWLHERKVGDVVEVRGPVKNWDWKDGVWDEIVMISGGTGITPFYQLLRSAFAGEEPPQTRFSLLHSSPTPLELPPQELLDPLQAIAQTYPKTFSLRIFVDSAESQRLRSGLPQFGIGRVGRKAIDEALTYFVRQETSMWSCAYWRPRLPRKLGEEKILFLLCGPDPMMAAIAGPQIREGRVGGILGEMGIESGQVWTL